jgi:hypothetical protein
VRDENRARLDDVMVRYEKRLAEIRRRQMRTQELHDTFIDELEHMLDGTVRVTMEDVGAALRAHGHDFEISATQGYTDVRGRLHRTQLTMRVFPAGIQRALFTSTNTPYIAFAGDWMDKRVAVLESTVIPLAPSKVMPGNGRSGRRAVYSVKQLTPPVIEREIVDVLTDVFGLERVRDYRHAAASAASGRERDA